MLKGYTHFQIGSYLLWFAEPVVVGAFLLAVLSIFVQVLVPQKFIGLRVMLVYVVASIALGTAASSTTSTTTATIRTCRCPT